MHKFETSASNERYIPPEKRLFCVAEEGTKLNKKKQKKTMKEILNQIYMVKPSYNNIVYVS